MKTWIAKRVKNYLLGAGHYARSLRDDAFPGVAVLCYHGIREPGRDKDFVVFRNLHVSARDLEAHCEFIRETCHPISLDDWRVALAGGAKLPTRPVLITFDDGYESVFTLAKPILERYDIPAVVFVCSEPVEERRPFWFDAVARAQGEPEVERAKALRYQDWWTLRARELRNVEDDDSHAPLSVAQVKELAAAPGFEIGGHTGAHPILGAANVAQQREQILTNKTRLETWTGKSVRSFAYPNGRRIKDYTADTVKIVEECGFDFAFTTHHDFARPEEPFLERSRFLMLASVGNAELAHRLCYSFRR